MKIKLTILISAALLSSCTPFVNEQAISDLDQTARRADAYERDGYSPRDAWDTARIGSNGYPFGTVGSPGITPIAGWGIGTQY